MNPGKATIQEKRNSSLRIMNRHFFLWYYTRGLAAAFVLSGNLIRFVAHRFHILGLVTTLCSPWKRDVTVKDWRGLHPIKSLQRLMENLISRFLGMLVRLVIVGIGVTALIGISLPSAVILGLFIFGPFLLVVGLIFSFIPSEFPFLGPGLLFSGVAGIILAFLQYLSREQDEPETTDIAILKRQSWFRRLLGRLGLEKKELDSSVLKDTKTFLNFLAERGIDQVVFEQAVRLEHQAARERFRDSRLFSWENLGKSIPIGKGWNYAYTPHLDRYVLDLSQYDLTEYAHATLVGRQEEFKVAILALERPTQNSVLLVGDPGIGKKILVHHLARLIRENFFDGTRLGESRMLIFDIGSAVSDAINQGVDTDSVVRQLLGEAAYAGNVILVIENIHTVLGGDPSHQSLASVLAEFLALPGFRLIATTTSDHYHTLARADASVLKFLETIYFHETTEEETLLVLLDFVQRFEQKQVLFTLPGLQSIIAQSSRYRWEVPFPERALDLAEETLTYFQANSEERFIGPKTVEAFMTLKTGMPTGTIGAEEKDKLLKLEQYLHERVIGQNEAVKQVAEAMRRARAGLSDVKRPLGSFIFLGPTGVGKTETVKAFAECYFGSEDSMIRLDMSEYQTSEAVTRLISSETMGIPGQLTDLVKEKPFSILLLDELEKAYPKALDIFLQILDEGFVTDSAGEKVSFRNTIIIATSNAGAPIIKAGIDNGTPFADVRKQVLDFVVEQGIYRLEFLNRFDGVIFFESLKHEELIQVTQMKLKVFTERLKKEKNITIEFASGVAEKIVERGYEPEFGARSINRYIEDTIEDAVIRQIISGSVSGGGTLSVTADQL